MQSTSHKVLRKETQDLLSVVKGLTDISSWPMQNTSHKVLRKETQDLLSVVKGLTDISSWLTP
jgi:hypothetical protein